MLLKLFHITAIVLYLYTIWYDQMYVELPFPAEGFAQMPFKARHIFLTMWCLLLQTVYFTLSLLNDFYGTNEATPRKPPLIRKIKDTIFSLALPVAMYVTVVFWSIFAMNKDFIMPKEIEILFPKWINHSMHTAITPFIFIEMFVTKRNYPSRRLGISVILTFILSYAIWMHVLYYNVGMWMYPFLDLLNWPIRTMFCALSGGFAVIMYFLGEKINYLVSPRPAVYNTNGTNGVIKKIH